MNKSILLIALALVGCSNFPVDNRTAEQIAADKSAVKATCSNALGPGYSGRTVQVQIDSTVVTDGTVGVDTDCKITFTNTSAASVPTK